jgi:hypothetical protein
MKQTEVVQIRLTATDKAALKAFAEVQGWTLSTVFRRAASAAMKGQLGTIEVRRGFVASRQTASALSDKARDIQATHPDLARDLRVIASNLAEIATQNLDQPR